MKISELGDGVYFVKSLNNGTVREIIISGNSTKTFSLSMMRWFNHEKLSYEDDYKLISEYEYNKILIGCL